MLKIGTKFYRELGKNQIKVEEPPQMEQVEQFWQKIWENEKHHNEIADWIKKEEAKHTLQVEQEWKDIEKDESHQ